ncbi:CBS domain-containing protein [Magnetovibrio sp. PR-2]|uniref:CBS domain-containing protein n=1 Tax=Magnetovibrio sp. PR-2 TaxID=3120356 RepID=UPI002FCE0D7C
MAPIKVSIYADEKAKDVIDFMVEKHMGLVPVTERDGTFAGLISGDSLMTHMLPKALSTMGNLFGRGGLQKASFLNETAEDMKHRLDGLGERTIGELLDRKVKSITPDTPLIDALMMIKDKQYVVPVVDENKKLLGAISFFSVLYGLKEEYDREAVAKLKAEERAKRQAQKEEANAAEEGKQ